MILLVHSRLDPAGINIAKSVLEQHIFDETAQSYQGGLIYQTQVGSKIVNFITLNQESVTAQNLSHDFSEVELIVFLSRHSSQSGTPTLTVHAPGNFGKAELGGLPCEVSVAPANAMQSALATLNRLNIEQQLGFEVSYECTHHGPSLQVPCMFVELGSSEAQWGNQKAAAVVARAALDAIADFCSDRNTVVIGVGGTHYSQKFTQIALSGKAAFGHIIPKYAISCVDAQTLRQCVARTLGKVEFVVVDWKGVRGEDKPHLLLCLKEVGVPIMKV